GVHEISGSGIPPHHSAPCAEPNLSLAVAIDSLRPAHVQSAGGRQRTQCLAIPPERAAIPGSDPYRPVRLDEQAVCLTQRPSICGKNLNKPLALPAKQSAHRTY